jgi:UPF0176 protein
MTVFLNKLENHVFMVYLALEMAHPHFLKNRLNKAQAFEKLATENFSRKTFSFYRYVSIKDPVETRNKLFAQLESLGCLGRIYIAQEGINAQMNVPETHWDQFVDTLYAWVEFNGVPFKHAVEDPTEAFWKLTIKTKTKIVADGLEDDTFDAADVGQHLSALEFHEKLDEPGVVCVDMRNFYESEVGHFEGAITPDCATFREELPMVKATLANKKDKEVLLYCTGGIRCEKASSYLRHHGFKNVYQLHGGIIEYAHQIKAKGLESKFKGKNYVFDDRTAERITEDVLSHCHQCDTACDTHVNCSNQACNLLFVQCENCGKSNHGTCSSECLELSQLPLETQRARRAGSQKADAMALGKSNFRRPRVSSTL